MQKASIINLMYYKTD